MSLAEAQASGEFVALASIAGIRVDLRYASPHNFLGRNIYGDMDCAWLHRDAALALSRAQAQLNQLAPGAQLLVLDALRPHRIQIELFESLRGTGLELYLAPPERGSIHSFGMALDVTIVDAKGCEVDMGTGFDAMVSASHPEFEAASLASGELTPQHIEARQRLRQVMTGNGFQGISTEWWHFDCGNKDQIRAQYARVD